MTVPTEDLCREQIRKAPFTPESGNTVAWKPLI